MIGLFFHCFPQFAQLILLSGVINQEPAAIVFHLNETFVTKPCQCVVGIGMYVHVYVWGVGCITRGIFSTMHCAPMILSCPVYMGTHWHVSFFLNLHPHPAPGNQSFEITMMGQKIKYWQSFHIGGLKDAP